MSNEKTAVTEFFKPKFQKLGLYVLNATIDSNVIKIYVIDNYVDLWMIDELRAILDWELDSIWVESGILMLRYV